MAFAAEQALMLLAQRIPEAQVAATLGVDPSYISQLMADEDFAAKVNAAMGQAIEEDVKFDDKLAEAEQMFLENIVTKGRFANLQQSLSAFKIVNGAKQRRDRMMPQTQQGNVQIVQVLLPASVVPDYKMNTSQEIVEVDGRTMVSASPKTLEAQLLAKKVAIESKAERTVELIENMQAKRPKRVLPKNAISADLL